MILGQSIVPGKTTGRAVVTHEPLSFWGGYDPKTGEVVDRRHELSGSNLVDRILALPTGRGSSTASAILLESIRNGTAPAAIIFTKTDPILTLGAIIADELWGRSIPILTIREEDFDKIPKDRELRITPDGRIDWDE